MSRAPPPDDLFHLVTENTTDVIMLVDLEGRIQYINHTAPDLTVEGVLGTPIYDYLRREDAEYVRATLAEVARTGRPGAYVTIYEGGEAPSRWESRVGPVKTGDAVTGFVIVASDVTERHEAAAHRDRLFELSVDLLCLVGFDGFFKRVSPSWVRALGYSEQELLSRPFADFLHPDDVEPTLAQYAGVMQGGGEVVGFRNRYRCKDGSLRTLEWTASVDVTMQLVVAIARDVTEQQALQDQLRQAQKMDAVGQLAGGIAHDFNNLMQAVLGNVHFARSADPGPKVVGFLGEIEAAAERAAALTRQLLAFSRRQPIDYVPLDMNALARDLVVLLRRVIPESIQIDLVEGEGLNAVAGDHSQLEQVVMNLCLNARDAMPAGGRLTITTESALIDGAYRESHPWAKPGCYVLLTVSDTGAGIPADIRERVFDPFFTTKPPGQGAGLGLSTVYGIVRLHGGMLRLQSGEGQGTTFQVYLPVTQRPVAGIGTELDSLPRGGSERILVAEDEQLVMEVVLRVLEENGYDVVTAASGREAVGVIRARDDIDMVLLDVVMPEMGGPEAAAQIAALRPGLPVLFSSGYSDASRFTEALPEGARALSKPYKMDELLICVREVLDAAQAGDA